MFVHSLKKGHHGREEGHSGRSVRQLVTPPPQSLSREECWCQLAVSFSFHPGLLAHGMVPLAFRVGQPTSVCPVQIIHHRHGQRCISIMIVHFTKLSSVLTIKGLERCLAVQSVCCSCRGLFTPAPGDLTFYFPLSHLIASSPVTCLAQSTVVVQYVELTCLRPVLPWVHRYNSSIVQRLLPSYVIENSVQ